VKSRHGGSKEWIGGVRRVCRGNGRVDLKVKLAAIAHLAKQWFRYILHTVFSDIQRALEAIEAGEEPP
jgi:hypothetical protein